MLSDRPPVDFSTAQTSSKPPLFRLSALLQGHSDDVRCLAGDPYSRLFSSSRDSTARAWVRKGPREGTTGGWAQARVFEGYHTGFVNAVAWLPARLGDNKGFLVTGGQDALIQVYSLDTSSSADSPAPFQTLLGHAQNVCSLHASADGKRIVSGSWDCSARVWDAETWSCTHVLTEHGAAVWDVLAINVKGHKDTAITACADGLIRLFEGASRKLVFKGHEQPVRALAKVLPDEENGELFASASNDGSIRIWSINGDAITSLDGHQSFIYALISIPSASGGGLASSGEDGIVKVWNDEDGEEDQEILLPALSVWSLTSLANGDLACGCSDNLIWVFTRDETRVADETTMNDYETRLAKRSRPPASATSSTPSLPLLTTDALETPGSKEGEIKLVSSDGGTHAYSWTGSSWENLGEVVDQDPALSEPPRTAPASKTLFEGDHYDFVFSIDVKDDEPPLKLPYNLSDDVHEVATRFIATHALPDSYTDRIVQFIRASAS